jgi:hypothetical protein
MATQQALNSSLTMGVLCALIGTCTALAIHWIGTGNSYQWFLVAAPAAAFLTGAVLWWLLLARKGLYGTARGALTGAAAGALAHWVCWMFILIGSNVCFALTGGCTGTLGDAPMGLLEAVPATLLFSGFSLLFFGWFTIPAGALIGGLLARSRSKMARPTNV